MSPGLASLGSIDGVRTACFDLIPAGESCLAGLAASSASAALVNEARKTNNRNALTGDATEVSFRADTVYP